jgi:hypothetical protein
LWQSLRSPQPSSFPLPLDLDAQAWVLRAPRGGEPGPKSELCQHDTTHRRGTWIERVRSFSLQAPEKILWAALLDPIGGRCRQGDSRNGVAGAACVGGKNNQRDAAILAFRPAPPTAMTDSASCVVLGRTSATDLLRMPDTVCPGSASAVRVSRTRNERPELARMAIVDRFVPHLPLPDAISAGHRVRFAPDEPAQRMDLVLGMPGHPGGALPCEPSISTGLWPAA